MNEHLIAELQEDYDLLTYDRKPTPEEAKIASDILVVITLLKKQEMNNIKGRVRHD